MEFADETYNVGNQAGQENLEAARFKAAQTSWPVRLYHGYHMVGIFDIAVPWNSRTKEWDYSGLESLDAAIFACLRKDGSHPITVVPVDWLQVKSVHRATVAMRTK